jgi:methylmalonyl-CoA mutase
MANKSQSEKEAINMSEVLHSYSRQDWEELALETLSGESVDSLNEVTNDEIGIKAIYSSEDQHLINPAGIPGRAPFTRGVKRIGHKNGIWDVRALIDDSNPELANTSALNELLNGSISLFIDSEKIGIQSFTDLDKTLEDIFLNMTSIYFKPSLKGSEVAKWMIELWDKREIENSDRHGGLGVDPIGVAVQKGIQNNYVKELSEVPDFIDRNGSSRAIAIDSSFYPELGGSTSAELAYSLSVAVSYLRELEEKKLEIETIIKNMYFTYSSSCDQFMTIAKFRAARRLWSHITKECGVSSESQTQSQHAITSNKTMSKKDPWFNSFQATVAAFAAGIGGAQAITVVPFPLSDEISGEELKRRMARNTQLLLAEESHIGRVIDPAGGSWFVEELTEHLAQKSWDIFQQIESSGGITEVLKNEQKIKEVLRIRGSNHE